MALDVYADIWNRVLLRAPDVSHFLAQDVVTNAFRRVAERRRWSWLIKFSQFISPAQYKTGTVTVTQGSTTVTGASTVWTSDHVGRQFRIGVVAPIYTIVAVPDATTITLDTAYGGTTAAGATYQIYQCYFHVPTDFHSFLTVWDPAMNWQLNLDIKQEELNVWDSQRATMGNPWMVSYYDSNIFFTGYVAGNPPLPRYELWPHFQSRTIPFLYEARATDLKDTGATLPRYIRGDMLLEIAMADVARWPGTSTKRNPYYDLALARQHDTKAEYMIAEAERQDDEVSLQDLMRTFSVPIGLATPYGDAAWIQRHAIQ